MHSTLRCNGQELIDRLNKGDQHAMGLLFKKYHGSFIEYAARFIDNRDEAKDIVAIAFIKVWEKRNFEHINVMVAFLVVVIRNACNSYLHLRRQRIVQHRAISYLATNTENNIEMRVTRSDLYRYILQEAEALPPARKKIFKMIYQDQLSVIEIASILKISVDTVRVQKARAINTLINANRER
jgi:RNA polymerase sigma factor (sigma-70 family)